MPRCIHGGTFPCPQCKSNRSCNEHATGKKLTEAEFRRRYQEDGQGGRQYWTVALAGDDIAESRCVHGVPMNVFCGRCES